MQSANSFSTAIANNKLRILFFIKLIIAAALIVFIFLKFKSVHFSEILQNINVVLLFTVIILAFLNIFLQYKKWELLCSVCLKEENKNKILSSLFCGFASGIFTPGRIGEYVGRAIPFIGRPILEVSITALIDKLFNLFFILVFGIISFVLFLHLALRVDIFILLSIFVATSLILLLSKLFINTQNHFIKIILEWKVFRSIADQFKVIKKLDRSSIGKLSLYSFIFFVCFIVQYALLVSAYKGIDGFFIFIWAGTLVAFIKTILPPISLGEIGIRETASIYFLTSFGFDEQTGFNAAFLLFIINIIIPSLIGLLFLMKRNNGN